MHPRFLIIVFDALRPDMVAPQTMPNLAAFAATASAHPNSRAVFPSETRVNTTSLVTGTHPGGHGIVANIFFDPDLAGDQAFNTAELESLGRGEAAHGGNLVTAPALGDLLAASGLRFAAISSGTPGNARFLNPRAATLRQPTFSVHGPAACSSPDLWEQVTARFGPPPPAAIPNTARCDYVADVLLGFLLPEIEADVTVIWFSEPDISYHYRGIGSAESLAAIRAVDTAFGRILDWWRASPEQERIQIVAMSDHGQIATGRRIDIIGAMRAAGFAADTRLDPAIDIACVPSYSGNLHIRSGDRRQIARLVDWLSEQPWCGLLFSSERIEGTFPADLVGLRHPRTPHILFTLRAEDAPNAFGLPGRCLFADQLPEGGGIHGGLHPRELNNFLLFGGSLFAAGRTSTLPCGITDIAPTILHCLGLSVPAEATGRVLTEALATTNAPDLGVRSTISSVERNGSRQRLGLSRVGSSVYLDGGWRD